MTDHLFYRQVHPTWVQNGRPSSQTFTPTPKDAGKLSVFDSMQMTAPDSFEYYTKELALSSCGVLAISVSELDIESAKWELDGIPIPAHAYIDFRDLPQSQAKKLGQKLNRYAVERSWVYQPSS